MAVIMSSTIEIKGSYSQKTEIFGITISHHTGNFDVTKPLGGASWSQGFGPATITESIEGSVITVAISAFGASQTLFKTNIEGHNDFKIELDSGNFVKGTVTIKDGV